MPTHCKDIYWNNIPVHPGLHLYLMLKKCHSCQMSLPCHSCLMPFPTYDTLNQKLEECKIIISLTVTIIHNSKLYHLCISHFKSPTTLRTAATFIFKLLKQNNSTAWIQSQDVLIHNAQPNRVKKYFWNFQVNESTGTQKKHTTTASWIGTANSFYGTFPLLHISSTVKSQRKQKWIKMHTFISLLNFQHMKLQLRVHIVNLSHRLHAHAYMKRCTSLHWQYSHTCYTIYSCSEPYHSCFFEKTGI
jgi:hypothetical protein